MTKNNDYEKRLQETYERFRRQEIKAEEIEPAMLVKIDCILQIEMEEKLKLIEELVRLVREYDNI